MEKKLYRSNTDKKLCGVLGGLAEYIGMDSTVLRIAYVLLSLFVIGSPVIVYIVMALIMPEPPVQTAPTQEPPYQQATYTDVNGQ